MNFVMEMSRGATGTSGGVSIIAPAYLGATSFQLRAPQPLLNG
jgi:hypothetical protein